MKKIILLLVTISIAHTSYSQAAASLRGGLVLSNGSTYFGPGASFQYGLNENMVVGLNADYHIGSNSAYLMNIEPRFDYYLKSAFDGLHIGSNMSYVVRGIPETKIGPITVPSSSSGQLALGGLAGYTHSLNDKLFVDASVGGAYFLTGKAVAIRPTLSLGYKFGGK